MAEEKKTTKKTKAEEKAELEDIKATSKKIVEKEAEEIVEDAATDSSKATAKAGKRSEKGLKEAEEKQEKIERQKAAEASEKAEEKRKVAVKPARAKIEHKGKKYKEVAKKVDKTKLYSAKEAVELAIATATTKFDSTVELHARLNVDPKQADQNIRDSLTLPAGTGKKVRVAVFADEDDVKLAKSVGADVAGSEEFLTQLDKGVIDFDILISTPSVMVKLSKYARILGPKGLMPNPKSGTVTKDVVKAVKESKAGKVEYRVDSTGIIHLGIGKVSFGAEKINQNLDAVFASLKSNKPSSIKGIYVKSLTLTTTMGPGIKFQSSDIG